MFQPHGYRLGSDSLSLFPGVKVLKQAFSTWLRIKLDAFPHRDSGSARQASASRLSSIPKIGTIDSGLQSLTYVLYHNSGVPDVQQRAVSIFLELGGLAVRDGSVTSYHCVVGFIRQDIVDLSKIITV